ncbi:Propanoyl-CoA C-acyltransferase [Pyrolobus fumarii 1A]|uniref:Propanoyl-CoA C-acyltransferase n=1 Tax=Pyrolobus fumarii (strain DSM 11204 / 1A) TaxID=694429 RepID=G0EDF0_PYRF1|nr:thiolase family protein [Pyrolobus fumarii]AEM38635.1 Propanoyl-CoA C-acyltransferase [Pyrolobus fumarii 1A]
MRRVFIASVGLLRPGRHYDLDYVELVDKALLDAEKRGGLCTEPEAIVVASAFSGVLGDQLVLGDHLATWLGLTPRPAFRVEAGLGSGGAALALAYGLVASGAYRSVLLVGVEKLADHPTWVHGWVDTLEMDSRNEGYYGMGVAAAYALMARYYMETYGVTRRQLSLWPVRMHENARGNPYAALRNPLTPEAVERSPLLAEPLHQFDAGPVSDGAAVVLLVGEGVEGCEKHVEVKGVEAATDYQSLGLRPAIDELRAVRIVAERLYKRFNLTPINIDVIELRDVYSITGLLALESLGLVEKGHAARALEEGRFGANDRPVVNPSGGTKARGEVGGATGVYQIVEAYLQLIGEGVGVNVDNARRALVVDIGGPASNATATLLERV